MQSDGILLIEVDRVLRAGAYFVWSPQEHQENVWRGTQSGHSARCSMYYF